MYSSHKVRCSIAYGLVCAGTLGFLGTAMAASDNASDHSMSQGEQSQTKQLSDEVNDYNKHGGSFGKDNGHMNDSMGGNGSGMSKGGSEQTRQLSDEVTQYNENHGSMNKEKPPANSGMSKGSNADTRELSREVDQYNENRGSLQDNDAARAGTTTGDLDNDKSN